MLRARLQDSESLGRMLQQGRLVMGLTQRQLAQQLGISQRYVWEMEAGKPSIFTDRLFQMMRATGVTFFAELDETRLHETELDETELDETQLDETDITSADG